MNGADLLTHIPAWAACLAILAVPFSESELLVGFLLSRGHHGFSLWLPIYQGAVAEDVGGSVSYCPA